jgi:hypothetical protein
MFELKEKFNGLSVINENNSVINDKNEQTKRLNKTAN